MKPNDRQGNIWQQLAIWGGGLLLLLTILPFAIRYYIGQSTRKERHVTWSGLQPTRVAIVFGAGVYQDGTPTPMLADRLESAIDLYYGGKVQKILMSGDNSSSDYDEVTNMKRYVLQRGIPEKDVTLDYAGFSTYETCYRARSIFGVEEAILVTQSFHLPRAVYICSHLGITVQGLGTPDAQYYARSTLQYYQMRELASCVKAFWQVHVTRPKPTFLGEFEGIP